MSSESYSKTYEVIWADMDPNNHMRHSVYNDYAAQTRVAMFNDFGMPIPKIAAIGLGPILFKEETKFLKEISLSEQITVSCAIKAMRKDAARWTITHNIFKEDGQKAAQIIVDGAWLDLQKRKLGIPPKELLEASMKFPRTDDFFWID
ncbi:acyl-CoA thioesterase [Fodinibius sp. Rm-B-1B1-1]|uniref:acyl-CoA thioesterase n=1 Tax=Fodinibius alkaliphilus TaxID=3140241 RepID=UPI00315B214D